MGVPGLTTFVDQNPELLSDHKLQDTRLIIDGNNLYHFLYYYFRVGVEYGGDYSVYAQKVRYFFQTLDKCKISPFVVLDGGYDANDKKLQTALKRAKERIHLANFLSYGQRGRILPILCYETFRQVLEDMDIPHVSCDFEADDQIAALAVRWECPVLTNDSDFFIYDLKAGTVLLDYLNLDIKTCCDNPDSKYLNVQMYHRDTFLKKFKNMDQRMFPLFATLIGNDYVDVRTFETFFASAHLPKPSSKRFCTPDRYKKITSLLMWLESAHDFDYALGKILGYFKEEKREAVKSVIEKSVKTYTQLETNLHSYFEEEDLKAKTRSKLKTFDGNSLPYWFVEHVRSGDLPPMVLDALVLHRVILLSQIETMSEPSAYTASLPIRQTLYAILLTLDCELAKTDSKKEANRTCCVTEYSREHKNLRKFSITPQFELQKLGQPVPYLQSIPHLEQPKREEILLAVIGSGAEGLHKIATHLRLVMVTLIYWCKHAVPRVNEIHLATLITGIIRLDILAAQQGSRSSLRVGQDTVGDECDSRYHCSAWDAEMACENLAKFTQAPKHNKAVLFDSTILHAFSQFQACLRDVMSLNQLLLRPFFNPNPAQIFSGTFAYNLCRELESRTNMCLFVEELLVRGSDIGQAFRDLLDYVKSSLPDECLKKSKWSGSKNKKKRERKAAKKEGASTGGAEGMEDEDCEERTEGAEGGTLLAACDVTNRFESLMMEE